MITAVEIENFKGVRERTRIEIKPITLLFGPNSAGKSTLLHALQLAREVFTRRNLDVDVTDGGANFIDLGGFRNYVHGRDLTKAVTLRFDLDLSSTDFLIEYPFPEHLVSVPGLVSELDISAVGDEIRTGWVEIQLGWSRHDRRAYVVHYTVGIDGQPLARILPGTAEYHGEISHLNIHHPLVRWSSPADNSFGLFDYLHPQARSEDARMFFEGEPVARHEIGLPSADTILVTVGFDEGPEQWLLRRFGLYGEVTENDEREYRLIYAARPNGTAVRLWGMECHSAFWTSEEARDFLNERYLPADIPDELGSTDRFDRGDPSDLFNWSYIQGSELALLHTLNDCPPNFDRSLTLAFAPEDPEPGTSPDISSDDRKVLFERLLSRLLLVPGRVLRAALTELRYIGPVRDAVPRHFTPLRFPDTRRWAGGIAAWEELARDPASFVASAGIVRDRDSLSAAVNEWLSREERLNTGFGLHVERFRELPAEHELSGLLESGGLIDDTDPDKIKALLGDLPVRRRPVLVSLATHQAMYPADVGQGITQVVPVIVAALHPFDHGDSPRGGLVAIEQPELHLHPASQVGLGDLFITAVHKLRGQRLLVETHSEHLLLRILRRIRQTSGGTLPLDHPGLTTAQLAVVCFEPPGSGGPARVYSLRVDDQGEFLDPWPRGFFDERSEELFGP